MSLPLNYTLAKIPQQVRSSVVNGAYTKVGVVRSVVPQDGLPSMAIVDFDDETGVESKLMNGAGTPTHPGMTVRVERQGGVIDPTWKIVDVLSGPRISFGEPVVALMAKPVVPGASSGGVYTESQTATADNPNAIADPGAAVKARVYLYPRSVVLGSYSAYQQRAKAIRVQGRELGDTEWPDQFSDWPINPNALLYGYTSGAISASATSITFVTSVDRVNEMLVDQPAYWQIESEIVLAIAEATVTPGQYTLTVVAHNGVDDATLGQGFVASASGRGLEGTTAASHAHNSVVTLLSASVAPGDLRPGTDYELRLAFVNASNQAGPWSDIVGVTTWKQPIPPAAPVFLASPEGVQQLGHDIQAQWTPVTTDASGEFRSDVKRYIVVRALTSLGATFAIATYGNDMTMTELQTAVNAAGATIVADTPASVVSIPATKGNGNWIGVAAVGSEGLFSQWDWDSDTLAPPTPDPDDVIIYEVEEGIAFQVPENSTSINAQTGAAIASPAHRDTGWVEYLLWQAGTSSGGSAVIVGRMRASSGVVAITGGTTGYYKITSVDGAGNMGEASAPNNAGWSSGWKLIFSRFAELGLPPNGNFQIPDQAGTNAKGWTPNINGGVTGMDFVYQNTGGLEGNKVYRFIVPSSPPSGPFGDEEGVVAGDLLRVIPATTGTGVVGTMWLYQDSGSTKQYLCYLGFAGSSDDDTWLADAGSFILETPSAVSIPSGTWTKVTINSVYDTLESNARSGRWLAWFRAVPGVGSGTDYSIYMDALKVTF